MNTRSFILLLTLIAASPLSAAEKSLVPSQGKSAWNATLSSGLVAGDTVYMEDGVYTDFQVVFRGIGTAENPIVLRARNYGKVRIEGQINVRLQGEYLVVDGLHFRNGWAKNSDPNSGSDVFEFRSSSTAFANHSRLTNCVFDSLNNPNKSISNDKQTERWVMLYGKNNRIDHCYFGYKNVGGVMIMVDIRDERSQDNNHIIERNFFGYRPPYAPGNGAETIRPGDSERSQLVSRCTIRENIFYQCDGEIEIISLKSCDNVVVCNIFVESAGMVVCRHGHRSIIQSNVFLGNNKNHCGGVRIINSGHRVYNNLFQDLKGTSSRSALCVMTAFDDSYPLSSYYQVKDCDIAFNTFVNCASIEMATASSYNSQSGPLAPIRTRFWNNLIYNENLITPYLDKGNTSGIDFKGNLFKIKEGSTFAKEGFSQKHLLFSKQQGFYYLQGGSPTYCMPFLDARGKLDYVEEDLTGNPRGSRPDAGAVNVENLQKKYAVPSLDEVGVAWYTYKKPSW